MTRFLNWLERNYLWLISMVIMAASNGLDGRYIRSYQPEALIGAIFGYGMNVAVDVSSELFAFEFVKHTISSQGRRLRRSWLLLVVQFGLIYFAVVFSYRQATLSNPLEPNWLRWSIACFAQTALVGLGVAQALRPALASKRSTSEGKAEEAGMPAGSVLVFPCKEPDCSYIATSQNGLNAHQRIHKNGHAIEVEN